MQVILTEDVYELGKRSQVVNVSAGYGRNYLIPSKLAIPATPGNLKIVEQQKVSSAKKESKLFEEAELLAGELNQLHLIVSRKAGESGTLFGSVTGKDLAEMVKMEGIHLDRRKIIMEHPIKSIGNHQIPVRPHSDVAAALLVSVVIEGEKAVKRVKRKDAETDRIVEELNSKVRELGLPDEGRIVTERFGPPPAESEPEAEAASAPQASMETSAEEAELDAPQEEAAVEPSDEPAAESDEQAAS